MMAWEIPVLDISLVAADDLQDFQYFFVKVNSDAKWSSLETVKRLSGSSE